MNWRILDNGHGATFDFGEDYLNLSVKVNLMTLCIKQ